MISNKRIVLIAMLLVIAAVAGCVLALGYSDRLIPLIGNSEYSAEYADNIFDTSEIISIDIQMEEKQWQEMLDNAIQETYYQCDIVINGTTFYSVGIRPKGNTSLSSIASDPENDRYSFKLEFDQFVDGQTCFGLDKLILNNSYADTTYMKEALMYDMFHYLDADASLYNYAKISVNGEYWGLYLALEAVEDSFMLRNFGMEKGVLYKPDGMNMGGGRDGEFPADRQERGQKPNFEQDGEQKIPPEMPQSGQFPEEKEMPQNGEQMMPPEMQKEEISEENGEQMTPPQMPQDGKRMMTSEGFPGGGPGGGNGANLNYSDDSLDSYSAIWEGAVTDSTDADHRRVVTALKNVNEGTDLDTYLNVENVLKYMAVHSFSVNEDSLSGNMAHNYYLYEAKGRLNLIPWDYNLALGGMNGNDASAVVNGPIDESYSSTQFFDALLENEEYLSRYHEYYSKLMEYFDNGTFEKTYQRIRNQIDELVKNDPNAMYTYEEYLAGAEMLYNTMLLRAESIQGQLSGLIPSTKERQQEDPSKLVDASSVTLSSMGVMNMGGGRPGGDRFGNESNRETVQNSEEQSPMQPNDRQAPPFDQQFVTDNQERTQSEGEPETENRQLPKMPENGQMPPINRETSAQGGSSDHLGLIISAILIVIAFLFVLFYKRKTY